MKSKSEKNGDLVVLIELRVGFERVYLSDFQASFECISRRSLLCE